MKMIVAGHLCLDIIPHWQRGTLDALRPGKMVQTEGVTFSTGGAVANTGIALKRLGFDPYLLARIGDDHVGEIIRTILRQEEMNPASIAVSPGATTSYTVVLNPPDTDRLFLHYPGTNDSFSVDDVHYGPEEAGIFHFGYPPLMRQMYIDQGVNLELLLRGAKEHGLITSLDMALPDSQSEAGRADWARILQRVLPWVDLFLPSLDELFLMLDRPSSERMQKGLYAIGTDLLEEMSLRLLDWGAAVIGIKLGAEGVYLRTGSRAESVLGESWKNRQMLAPVFKVDVQGTVGAGDTTIAGFLAGVSQGLDPAKVLTLANAVGAFCVEAVSSIAGVPHLTRVLERVGAGWERGRPTIDLQSWQWDAEEVFLGPADQI